jgi:hypothetical protein
LLILQLRILLYLQPLKLLFEVLGTIPFLFQESFCMLHLYYIFSLHLSKYHYCMHVLDSAACSRFTSASNDAFSVCRRLIWFCKRSLSPGGGEVNNERGEGATIEGDDRGRTCGDATCARGGGGEAARGNEVSQEVSKISFVNLWDIEGSHWSSQDQRNGSATT